MTSFLSHMPDPLQIPKSNMNLTHPDMVIACENTMMPNNAKCSFGGSSWLMELDALTGNRLNEVAFDLTGNGLFNIEDMVQLIDTNNDGIVNGSDDRLSVSGKKSTNGIIKSPGVVSAGTSEYKYTSGSLGTLDSTRESVTGGAGRMSWRQLR